MKPKPQLEIDPTDIDPALKKKRKIHALINGNGHHKSSKTEVPDRVEDAMKNLHPLEEQVLEYIFFDSARLPHSLQEAAEKFELTIQEVESIYAQGLRALRGGKVKGFPPASWN